VRLASTPLMEIIIRKERTVSVRLAVFSFLQKCSSCHTLPGVHDLGGGDAALSEFFLLRRERPVDRMEAPLPLCLDQHCCDDKGPLCAFSAHPVAQTVDSEMGGIRQPIIK